MIDTHLVKGLRTQARSPRDILQQRTGSRRGEEPIGNGEGASS